MRPDLSEWHDGWVVLCHMLGLEVIAVVCKQECCAFSGEPALQLGSQSTVLTYTCMLGQPSSSSGSSAVLKNQWVKQESAAVLLCSTQSARQGIKQHKYQFS